MLYCSPGPKIVCDSCEVTYVPRVIEISICEAPADKSLFFCYGRAGVVAKQQGHGRSALSRRLESGKRLGCLDRRRICRIPERVEGKQKGVVAARRAPSGSAPVRIRHFCPKNHG